MTTRPQTILQNFGDTTRLTEAIQARREISRA
jgi:hypothetical protein